MPGSEFVHDFLQFGFGFVFDFAAVAGNDGLHFRLPDDFTQDGLGGNADGIVRILHAEEVVFGVFDSPDNGQVDIDNVFVAGEHVAFGKALERIGIAGLTVAG